MYPTKHFILGTIFASFLFFLFPSIGFLGLFLIVASSVLIDVDHYLYYSFRKNDFSLKNSYLWFIKHSKKFHSLNRKTRNKVYSGWFFLHGIELLILFFFLQFFNKIFLFIFIGVAFHLFLDYLHNIFYFDRIDKFSILYDLFKHKKLRFIGD